MFEKGNVIVNSRWNNVEIIIVNRYKSYYTWKYAHSDEIFDSRNSTDPLFQNGWSLKI